MLAAGAALGFGRRQKLECPDVERVLAPVRERGSHIAEVILLFVRALGEMLVLQPELPDLVFTHFRILALFAARDSLSVAAN